MKYSQFNTIVPYKGKYVYHNSLTNKFLYIDPLLKELIDDSKENLDKLKDRHPQFYNALRNLGFIVKKKTDEVSAVKKLVEKIDGNKEEFYLLINPTLNCNFSCWYCYENHIKGSKISDSVLERLKLLISNQMEQKEIKRFVLHFFGGEPLLYFKKLVLPIIDFSKKEAQKRNVLLLINFTTNGYLIDDKMIKKFIKYKVNNLQITLDGNKEEHDKVRFTSKNNGSYDKIIENMKKIVKNNINLTLRINYTRKNFSSLSKVFKDFKDLSFKERKRILLSLNKVWEENEEGLENEITVLKDKAEKFGFKLPDPLLADRVRFSCYADKINQALVNYNGDVFKCSARDFKKENAEGFLNKDGLIEWNEKQKERIKSRLKNKPCLECNILPICGGGCSQQAIEYQGKEYCVNHFDDSLKNDIVLSMFLSKNTENV